MLYFKLKVRNNGLDEFVDSYNRFRERPKDHNPDKKSPKFLIQILTSYLH